MGQILEDNKAETAELWSFAKNATVAWGYEFPWTELAARVGPDSSPCQRMHPTFPSLRPLATRYLRHSSDTLQVTGTSAVSLAGFNAAEDSIEAFAGNGHEIIGSNAGEVFDFSGLTSLSSVTFVDAGTGNDALIGWQYADDLRGGNGNDILNGGAGNDHLAGGGGNDMFVHKTGYGTDTVTDYKFGLDKFDLTETGVHTFSDMVMTQVGKDVHIAFGSGDELDIVKTTTLILTAHQSDFIFH